MPDRRPGLGPLAGLEAALEAAHASWLALAACDLPCLTPAFWRLLCARAEGQRAVVVRDALGRLEPLAALYHRSALEEARARLDAGALGMHGLLRALGAREVPREALEAACGPAVLRNVNRPEDAPAPGQDPCRP